MHRDQKILQALKKKSMTAAEIGSLFACSEKSARNRIHALQKTMQSAGAEIIARKGLGYTLVIHDHAKFNDWQKQMYLKSSSLPETSDERVSYILKALLFAKDFIKREDFAQQLFVSEKTISSELKKVEHILSPYNLTLERIPSHGIRICGNEFSIRQCMLNCAISPMDKKNVQIQKMLDEIVESVVKENNLSAPSYLIESLKDYLALSLHRMQEGRYITDPHTETWQKNVGIYYVARYFLDFFEKENIIVQYTDSEVFYVSLYLWANRFIDDRTKTMKSYVIPHHTIEYVDQMIHLLTDHYHFNIQSDPEFYQCMLHHTTAAEIRSKYNIRIHNPDTERIQAHYGYAFDIASDVVSILSAYTDKPISDDEIGLYALLIQTRLPENECRLNAVYVYQPTRVEDYALLYQIKAYWNSRLTISRQCTLDELKQLSFKNYDCVISALDIQCTDIPVIRLTYADVLSDLSAYEGQLKQLYESKIRQFR